jgi:hypothetical protein
VHSTKLGLLRERLLHEDTKLGIRFRKLDEVFLIRNRPLLSLVRGNTQGLGKSCVPLGDPTLIRALDRVGGGTSAAVGVR